VICSTSASATGCSAHSSTSNTARPLRPAARPARYECACPRPAFSSRALPPREAAPGPSFRGAVHGVGGRRWASLDAGCMCMRGGRPGGDFPGNAQLLQTHRLGWPPYTHGGALSRAPDRYSAESITRHARLQRSASGSECLEPAHSGGRAGCSVRDDSRTNGRIPDSSPFAGVRTIRSSCRPGAHEVFGGPPEAQTPSLSDVVKRAHRLRHCTR